MDLALSGARRKKIYVAVDIVTIKPLNDLPTPDNRKCNIRKCTQQQNCMNTQPHYNSSSKYKGVYWHKRAKKWTAQIRVNDIRTHLGMFESQFCGALAYDEAARKHYGEYAWLNFNYET